MDWKRFAPLSSRSFEVRHSRRTKYLCASCLVFCIHVRKQNFKRERNFFFSTKNFMPPRYWDHCARSWEQLVRLRRENRFIVLNNHIQPRLYLHSLFALIISLGTLLILMYEKYVTVPLPFFYSLFFLSFSFYF